MQLICIKLINSDIILCTTLFILIKIFRNPDENYFSDLLFFFDWLNEMKVGHF